MMNVVQPDKAVTGDLLHTWHKKTNIKRPTFNTCLFQYDGTPDFSSQRVKYEIVLIHHSPCPSSIGNCRKGLFFVYHVVLRVHIHSGDYNIVGSNVLESTQTMTKMSLNQQILTYDSARAIMTMLDI